MPSKNPIKGYIACPTEGCGEICTVHAVGEHRLLETGDIPKNKRRLGQLYTVCPNCKTNQSAGKPFQTWIEKHMQPTREQVKAARQTHSTKKPHDKTATQTDHTTVKRATENRLETDNTPEREPNETVKSSVMTWMLGISAVVVVAGLWLTRRKKERAHEPIRGV